MTAPARAQSDHDRALQRPGGRRAGHPGVLLAGLRRLGVYLVVAALSLFCVIPFAWVMLASVDRDASLYAKGPTLSADNFIRFFLDNTTPRLLFNSLLISIGATLLALVLSMFGGYALSRFHFFGRKTLMFGILLVRVVPATATIVPLYLMMIQLQLNNTYLGIILVETAYQLPLVLWLMKGFFDAIPVELEEAAWTDGCSRVSGAVRIVFPLSRPGLGAAALFTFINVWGDFLTPLVLLTSPEKYPISIGLFQAFSGRNQVDWGLLTATAVLYMVPTVILYLFARRYLLQATFTGALKG
jgi:multiple sugar transport system permease protein